MSVSVYLYRKCVFKNQRSDFTGDNNGEALMNTIEKTNMIVNN